MGRLTPPQLLIISFLCAIIIGAVLLSLPAATTGPESLTPVDSLFTATSAVCVTGLIVKDTGKDLSRFGRWVVFVLFQMGGLGIMTFSTLFAVMLGRKIGLNATDVITTTLDKQNVVGLKKLVAYILSIAFVTELIGALALFFRWRAVTDWGLIATIENAVFHSVSGFCNAGFSLFSASLVGFESDPFINITMMALIVTGGLGFIVIMDITGLFTRKGPGKKLSLQTKIVLITSAVLIVSGAAVLFICERNNVMKDMTMPQRLWGSFFQSVTARTAGFNTLSIGALSVPSLVFIVFLMFIGASPGSTGGGIKTCTFVVLIATVISMLSNKRRAMILGRSISRQVLRESLVIFFLSLSWVFVATMILTYLRSPSGCTLIRSLFEVVSAFGTVGLSTGITPELDAISKICITCTMFAGRVGPLTIALAIAFKSKQDNYIFPEENIMVG